MLRRYILFRPRTAVEIALGRINGLLEMCQCTSSALMKQVE